MNINIYGSTGIIGTKTLNIINKHFDNLKVNLLCANNNVDKLINQIHIFSPKYVYLNNKNKINYLIFIEKTLNVGHLIIFINLIILISIIGDLLQSFFKRKNNLKDSGSILPGHGGAFDRFDSFISSIIFLLFYSILNL